MHYRILKRVIAIVVALGMLPGMIGPASAQNDEERMQTLPILVMTCETEPDFPLNPGGGRGTTPEELARYGCEDAEGVSITIYNQQINFFARCDTDAGGSCQVEAPADPERELNVAVHTATVPPGYTPTEVLGTTVHYTEFTGVGIVLLPTDSPTPESGDERTTLAVNVATCEDGTLTAGCDREAASALVQASSGEITAEGEPWLATNDDGWVSFDRASLGGDTIDLMLRTEDEPRFACTDLDSGDRLDTEWIEGREGNFIRVTPVSDGDVNCDVTLQGDAS